MTHVYAFGSICRGDFDKISDVDLLAVVHNYDDRLDPDRFSIYSYERIEQIWRKGNAFSWHLFWESRIIYASDSQNFLEFLGKPSEYSGHIEDSNRCFMIFRESKSNIDLGSNSIIFDLSSIFLAIRNMATIYSLKFFEKPIFSRDSARMLGERSLFIPNDVYDILMRARILSTRGLGARISDLEKQSAVEKIGDCELWIREIYKELLSDG